MAKQAIEGVRKNAFARDPKTILVVGYDDIPGVTIPRNHPLAEDPKRFEIGRTDEADDDGPLPLGARSNKGQRADRDASEESACIRRGCVVASGSKENRNDI